MQITFIFSRKIKIKFCSKTNINNKIGDKFRKHPKSKVKSDLARFLHLVVQAKIVTMESWLYIEENVSKANNLFEKKLN